MRTRAACRCSTAGLSRTRPRSRVSRRGRVLGVRRHRRSGEVLRDAASRRHRGRGARAVPRPPSLTAARRRPTSSRRAERDGLSLVTTEKDLARLNGRDDAAALARVARALPVRSRSTRSASGATLFWGRSAAMLLRALRMQALEHRVRATHRPPAGRRSSISAPRAGSARRSPRSARTRPAARSGSRRRGI